MRIHTLEKVFLGCLSLLVAFLWYHQIIRGSYFDRLSHNNRIRIVPLMPERGDILDRDGRKIATQIPGFALVVIPQELRNKELALQETARLLGDTFEDLELKYQKDFVAPFVPLTLCRDIPLEKVFIIEERKPVLEGIEIQISPRRFYPFGAVAANLIGYLNEIDARELEKLKPYGYRIKSLVGKTGIEKSFDIYLRGQIGGRQLEVDNRGNLIRILGEKKSMPGKSVELTINMEWQQRAQQLLDGRRGAILVMDIQDGQILVMESSPSFDPNLFIGGNIKEIRAVLDSPKAPLLNRAIKANFSPGSVFKLVTAIAGLETKLISPLTQFSCEGRLYSGKEEFRCWEEKGHGYQGIGEAIKHSCNVFFYKLGLELGPENMRYFAKLLGLEENSGIELKDEGKGLVPSTKWKHVTHREKWFAGDSLNLSIGQGFILVSPIQVLRLIAAIGNGGFLVKPYLVKGIGGMAVQEIKREYTGISQETLNVVRKGMWRVVNDADGTGNRAKIEGLDIAAKTATVQTGRAATHAWITGFLPYRNPKLAFVVFLEYGGRGGVEAADLCRLFFSGLKEDIPRYK